MNGDLAAIILFGGLLVWAVIEIGVINQADGPWIPPERASAKKEVILFVITAVLFIVITGIHSWLGVWPFGGGA